MKSFRVITFITVTVLLFVPAVAKTEAMTTQQRIDRDISQGKPVVVHVSVALADNKNQWIASVPESIGNGQKTAGNLYWGARYGLKTFFIKDAGWKKVDSIQPDNHSILERLVLVKKIQRNGVPVQVYLVADAWDGRFITDTIEQFLRFSAGHEPLLVKAGDSADIHAGGSAHLQVYIGHNALMDYFGVQDKLISSVERALLPLQSDAVVLACKSKPYFKSRLESTGSHSLVLTTGNMAPEAYTLAAIINEWVQRGTDSEVKKSAAAAYAKYQKINIRSAQRLFDNK